jgi:hypothetical protein
MNRTLKIEGNRAELPLSMLIALVVCGWPCVIGLAFVVLTLWRMI